MHCRLVTIPLFSLTIGVLGLFVASQTPVASDSQKIDKLIERLNAHEDPKVLLDPFLLDDARYKQLKHFAYDYKITLVREGPIQFADQMATVPARLTFVSSSGTSNEKMESSIHLSFVFRNGQWYFASYTFLDVTSGEIIAISCALILAVIWTCGTLIKWRSLRSQRTGPLKFSELATDYFQAINPLTWVRKQPKPAVN